MFERKQSTPCATAGVSVTFADGPPISWAVLPGHYEITRSQRVLSIVSLVTAFVLLAALGVRITAGVKVWHWWTPVALMAGIAAADFCSGMVHWAADTWGSDDLPVLGPRLLSPFRVHHLNPADFLRRRFIDTNGEVAFVAIPVLLALFAVPLQAASGARFAVFGLAFCTVAIFTNQIHQWAHMPSPPRIVRLLQDCGFLLGRAAHAVHHESPYDVHYCISTGWCNRPLEAIDFFRRLERVVTSLTGMQPRADDRRYEQRYKFTDA